VRKILTRAIIVAFILLFVLSVSTAHAADSLYYPTQTPKTTFDPDKFPGAPYTTVTVEVLPKQDVIPQGSAQTWTVVVTYTVTAAGSGKVNSAQVRDLELKWDNDLDGGYSITNPQVGIVAGPTLLGGNKWDVFVDLASGYFIEGTVFVLTFHVTTPDSLTTGIYNLVKVFHRSYGNFDGQESSSDHGIVIVFEVGVNQVIPEVPLGPVAASILMVGAFGAYHGFKKLRPRIPHF
jgi:hypothetical protein